MTWRLKRTKQCAKCPWRKDVDPHDIPNGYSVERHKALSCTIASECDLSSLVATEERVMACHELHDAHCVGWVMNQLGPGNNIALRLRMWSCENAQDIKLLGDQHERFEDTLPRCQKKDVPMTLEQLTEKHAETVAELIRLKEVMDALEDDLRAGHTLWFRDGEWRLFREDGTGVACGKSLREMEWLF